ncbi:M23 family metallopeptidase [Novosphingobium nitrogenifigens]|nr:M23 family metallopeptidase [Novosphingobium nitrogenifigens]
MTMMRPFLFPLLAMVPMLSATAVARPAHVRAALPAISSGFGMRIDPLRGTRAMHDGIDIPGRQGAPILAAASGQVDFAGWRGGYGNLVEILHADGTRTRYGHLSRIVVGPGDTVAQGQEIALMGSTGRSTGPHLHFEVRSGGIAVNPLVFMGNTRRFSAKSEFAQTFAVPGGETSPRTTISAFAQARNSGLDRPGGDAVLPDADVVVRRSGQ